MSVLFKLRVVGEWPNNQLKDFSKNGQSNARGVVVKITVFPRDKL